MSKSPAQRLASLSPELRKQFLDTAEEWVIRAIANRDWWWMARPEQQPPAGDWLLWALVAGRGFGKTRTGAEWIVDRALRYPTDRNGEPTMHLILADTLDDARRYNIEGPSGVLSVLRRYGLTEGRGLHYTRAPKPLIALTEHGTKLLFEGDSEDAGRGSNLASVWIDEGAKMRYLRKAWLEGILPALRADVPGERPRALMTGTPKPIKIMIEWHKRAQAGDPRYRWVGGHTFENAANLSADALAELEKEYGGTSLGRQELGGELLDDVEGALWSRGQLDADRVKTAPPLTSVVVAMDPAGTGQGDETGIVAVGRGEDGHHYVLADASGPITGREAAIRAWALWASLKANVLVVEDNFGKGWLRQVLVDAYDEMAAHDPEIYPPGMMPLKTVTAVQGKRLRAEPVAMRYEQHRSHMVGAFAELEDQMVTWIPEESKDSPDRVDALVHAEAYLRGREHKSAQAASPADLGTLAGQPAALAGNPLAGRMGGFFDG